MRRSIWPGADGESVEVIDQRLLPFRFAVARLKTLEDVERAIKTMQVRGAPLIGASAAYGVWLGLLDDPGSARLISVVQTLAASRPTAINLHWALERMKAVLLPLPAGERVRAARCEAERICDEDAATNAAIGQRGLPLIKALFRKKNAPVNVLTHCNAGWLATVSWGTALAPVYAAQAAGIPVHVWVDETRPRNQGASLTAWELGQAGISHRLIADNAGGHLMQHGLVDLCLVGADRVTASGDVCNKIGTYLKALAAFDNGVPFYAAFPLSTIDWRLQDGVRDIPIEERGEGELLFMRGLTDDGTLTRIRIAPSGTRAVNPAFDVTPARLVTGLITERGVFSASAAELQTLGPETDHD